MRFAYAFGGLALTFLSVITVVSCAEEGPVSDIISFMQVVDIDRYLQDPTHPLSLEQCLKLRATLEETGIAVIKDSRASQQDNAAFLEIMTNYFLQPADIIKQDERKEVFYQVGPTPTGVEIPACKNDSECQLYIETLAEKPKPILGPDRKQRFFWPMGKTPASTHFKELNADPVKPMAFPEWEDKMNTWGNKMMDCMQVVTEMLEVGYEWPTGTLTKKTEYGRHLLGPTASDLSGPEIEKGFLLTGFHSDLNFITIHGKSSFPGLSVWTKSGTKVDVRIPDGCLLIQAGQQLEAITAGTIKAGFHEVTVTQRTMEAIKQARFNHKPLLRISSTLFYHIATDQSIAPIHPFKVCDKYPERTAGEQVSAELQKISLKTDN